MPIDESAKKPALEHLTTADTGAPILSSALSWLDCRVTGQLDTGDHILYAGEVVAAGVNGEGTPFTLEALGWHYGG